MDAAENPDDVLDEIDAGLEELRVALINCATELGMAQENVRSIRETWRELASTTVVDPEVARVYTSAVRLMTVMRDEVRSAPSVTEPSMRYLAGLAGSALALNVTTDTTSHVITHVSVSPRNTLAEPNPYETRQDVQSRLDKLDPALANTYAQIWQVLHGTRADPERSALFAMRQTFDHLFSQLAPDDEVRRSNLWQDNPHGQITRRDRLRFALQTKIVDPQTAERLAATIDHALTVYQALNRAHERGQLDANLARAALREMELIVRDWVMTLPL